jgi:hypothetical protein
MLKRFISYYKPYITNIILRNVVPDEQTEETRKITLICILASILIA